jgi:hypothetical protein
MHWFRAVIINNIMPCHHHHLLGFRLALMPCHHQLFRAVITNNIMPAKAYHFQSISLQCCPLHEMEVLLQVI